ncbi:hypothetical protein [Amycolatopsis sp. NPDC049159]|uniref:hypothetical protein n=1 Tax=Amycolatopsis sp. NPDC049159 TaxID=3157210 RepID=UPI0033EACC1C
MDETQPSPLLTDLTELEQQVISAARRGEWAKPSTPMAVEGLTVTADPGLRVRAELLRDLLRGLHGDLDPRGIRVEGVRIVGKLDLDHITAVTGLSLRQCALLDGIFCRDADLHYLQLDYCLLTHLHADGLHTNATLNMRGATIVGANEDGAIRLPGAHIRGQLGLDRATVINAAGPALHADGLRADTNLFMRDATIRGVGELGAIRLLGAHVGGSLELDQGTNITNSTGPALVAERMRADMGLLMRDATISGAGELGAIRLLGAHIGNSLELDRATVTNATGPALHAERLRADTNLFMRDATISGAGKLGAIRLLGAHIGGQALLSVSRVDNSSGPLLVLHEMQIAGLLLFPPAVVCAAGRQEVSRHRCPDSDRTITAHGLTYTSLQEISWRQWLHLLVHHTIVYRPQPFQQLAATERAAGHDNNAREVLIAQQHDLRRRAPRALGNRLALGRHALWGWLGRYGYRAHRLVLALAVVLAFAAGLSLVAGHVTTRPGHQAAERVPPATAKPDAAGTPCSPVELIGLGIDRGLPLGATGLRARCDLDTATRWGQMFTVILWVLQALLWGLATLAIAAYTGLVRKPA